MRRQQKVKKPSIRKSCDLCNHRKKKCDGDGVNRCSLCIEKGQAHCVYSPRQPQKPRKPKTDPNPLPLVPLSEGAGMQQSFKRFRTAPSLATGLIGTEENQLLFDFFSCMGFLPLTCQQTVREAMVKVLAEGLPQSDRRALLFQEPGMSCNDRGALIPFSEKEASPKDGPADPSSCMFWCAVALGGLAVGRPFSRVVPYVDRARSALNGGPGARTADIARAWALMAYLYGFCGNTESFKKCQRLADMYLHSSAEDLTDQEEFVELVKHAGGLSIFYGQSATAQDVEGFLEQYEDSHPQPPKTITQSNMCLFVFQSYRRFGQAFFTDLRNGRGISLEADSEVRELEALEDALGSGENSFLVAPKIEGPGAQINDGNDYIAELDAQLFSEDDDDDLYDGTANGGGMIASGGGLALSKAEACDGAVARGGGGGCAVRGLPDIVVLAGEEAIETPAKIGNLRDMMKQAVPAYDALLRAVEMPQIRSGIGGLMINCSLVVLKAAQHDFAGSLERISRCVEVLVRYPGMCRFPMAMHISHLLFCSLVAMDNRDLYEVLRGVYNPMAPPGTVPIPPFEEWQGISPCCRHVYCRSTEESFDRIMRSANPEPTTLSSENPSSSPAASTASHPSMARPDFLLPSRTAGAAAAEGNSRRLSVVSDNSVEDKVGNGFDVHGPDMAAGVKEATGEAVQSLSPRLTGQERRDELDPIATTSDYGFQFVSKNVDAAYAAASASAPYGAVDAFEGEDAGTKSVPGAVWKRKASASNDSGTCLGGNSSGFGTAGDFVAAAPGVLAFGDGDMTDGLRGASSFFTDVKGQDGRPAVVSNGHSSMEGAGTCTQSNGASSFFTDVKGQDGMPAVVSNGHSSMEGAGTCTYSNGTDSIEGNGAGISGVTSGLAFRETAAADGSGSVEGHGMAPAGRSVNESISGSTYGAMSREKREDVGDTDLYNVDIPGMPEIADLVNYVGMDCISEVEEAMGIEKFFEDLDKLATEQPRRNAGVVG